MQVKLFMYAAAIHSNKSLTALNCPCLCVLLHGIILVFQVYRDPESQAILDAWICERNKLRYYAMRLITDVHLLMKLLLLGLRRKTTKEMFNPQFGSLFRTYHNATYFSRRLSRYADLYMSSLSSLLNYSLSHTFYPRRSALPHELGDPPLTEGGQGLCTPDQ